MNTQELIQQLEKIGLSDKEAKVYMASLKLGGAAIQDIAEEAGVNRSTTHVIMLGLIDRGLASSFTKGKKRHFAVESPEQLRVLLAEQEKVVMEKTKDLQKILPDLRTLYTSAETRPSVRFYEGKEGLKAISEDLFRTPSKDKEVNSFLAVDDLMSVSPEYGVNSKRRSSLNIRLKSIYTHKDGPVKEASSKALKREARYIPKNLFPFSASIVIYGKKVEIITLSEPLTGVLIENEIMANAMRQLFKLSWEAAEKYNKGK